MAFVSLTSCNQKSKSDTAGHNPNVEYNEDTQKKENETIYTRKGSCDDFISDIDFSSFCFFTNQPPKYRLVQNTDKSCQYEIFDENGHHTIDFTITFASFEGFNGHPEVAKTVFVSAFNRKKNARTRNQDSKMIKGLGDDAYIGFNNKRNEQYLGVRTGNVSFTFIFHHGKEIASQSCISDNKDLEKIGALVVNEIMKNL